MSYTTPPNGISGSDAETLWNKIDPSERELTDSTFGRGDPSFPPSKHLPKVMAAIESNCVLYFPSDRFEDPAWLNVENLASRADHEERPATAGQTERRIVQSSTLRANQNWLFDVLYDSRVFEASASVYRIAEEEANAATVSLAQIPRYEGTATNIHLAVLHLIQLIVQNSEARIGIAPRHSRAVSLMSGDEIIVSNIFQLSSGEVCLLNFFLSILRDYDSCVGEFSSLEDVQGIVVVDEIDLHLHVNHQYSLLPRLIQLFPKVQFVVTTHSPLFVLGMRNTLGVDGFELRRLPDGEAIDPEEFSEFGNAYQVFAETRSFEEDLKRKLVAARKPVLYVEGTTDAAYLRAAADRLKRSALLDRFDLSGIGGQRQLSNTWTVLQKLDSQATETVAPRVVLLLHDPEYEGDPDGFGNVFRRAMPLIAGRRISKGIENLFPNEAIERARQANAAYIDIEKPHGKIVRGRETDVPEQWTVNKDEKANLCQWFCENGTAEDFRDFAGVFDILEEILQSANQDEGAPH